MIAVKISRQRKWQIAQMADGKCSQCGEDRGESSNKKFCETCRLKFNSNQNKYKQNKIRIDKKDE